jgi:RNA-directed DNA polymerase
MRLKSGTVRVLVSKQALVALRSRLKEMSPRNWGSSLKACMTQLNRYMRGWLGYFGVCDPKQLPTLGREDAHLRRRLRALQLKQWKKKRLILSHLVRLGAPPMKARIDLHGGRRRWWMLSRCRTVNWALTNDYFAQRGLVSLADNWRREHERIWDIGPTQLVLRMG